MREGAIILLKSLHAAECGRRIAHRLGSVDVVEIDLPGLSLRDAAAGHDDAHEGKRDRRAERPPLITLFKSWLACWLANVAGHLALSAVCQRRGDSRRRLRSC